jgi:hypothetical protein
MEDNRSAQLHTSLTPQSTCDRVGAGKIVQGIAWRLRFYEGENGVFPRLRRGMIEVEFHNQAMEDNHSARLNTSTT